jgi:hypothetical protein
MYVDLNRTPPDYDAKQAIEAMRAQQMQGIVVNDPTKSFNTVPDLRNQPYHQGGVIPSNASGLFNQDIDDIFATPYGKLEERLNKLELENKFLKLKLLGMEGKFSQDEIKNIRAMLMSNDESSITLAETIIETA